MPDVFVSNTAPASAAAKQQAPMAFAKVPLYNHKPKPMGFFSTHVEMPAGLIFESQNENETVLLFLRKDFVTNVPWLFATIVLLLIPFFISFLFGLTQSPFAFLPPHFSLILQLFYYLVIATYVFVNFITWFYNISLITNIRVIDIDFADVIYKNVAATKVIEIRDVSFTQTGAIRTIFDYGDVLIQTEAATDVFDLQAVPRPGHVVDVVESLIGQGQ